LQRWTPIQQADKLSCESWNERMWSDGEPIDPSPDRSGARSSCGYPRRIAPSKSGCNDNIAGVNKKSLPLRRPNIYFSIVLLAEGSTAIPKTRENCMSAIGSIAGGAENSSARSAEDSMDETPDAEQGSQDERFLARNRQSHLGLPPINTGSRTPLRLRPPVDDINSPVVSHQKQPERTTTNAIEIKQNCRKINEANR
jgi:hypothetical protein